MDEQLTETATDETTQDYCGGISPILVIFLITGLLGLLAAGAMLLSEDRGDNPVAGSSNSVAAGVPELRPIRDWQADDFEAPTLDGGTVRLSDYAGRIVFINQWRTDCAPCVRELPALQAFAEEQGTEGAVVLAVNQGESRYNVEAFLASLGITRLTIVLDEDSSTERLYPNFGLPTTYIVGADGMVRQRHIGELTLDDLYGYVAAMESFSESS
jgi:peroxiredoxin